MPTLVCDTNIFISALVFGGVAEEVLELSRQEQIRICISEPIRQEVAGVLRRKFDWPEDRVRKAILAITKDTTLVRPTQTIHRITVDEPDNRILECAVAAHADYILSGDQHLLQLLVFEHIPILSLRAFLDTFHTKGHD